MTSSSHALPASAARESLAARALRFARTERGLVTIALAAVALHIADDNFLQPEPGTSPFDHLASGLIPIGILAGIAALYPRVRAGVRGWLALTFGALGIAYGVPSAYWLSQGEASGDHYTSGPLAILAGAVLMVTGLVVLWRSRRSYGSRRRTVLRRALTLAAAVPLAFAIFWLIVFPVGFAYTYTHTGRGVVAAGARRSLRADHRHDERLDPADGLVRPLQEPRRGDPLPRRDPLRRGTDADPSRLRRPAPQPARPGHERGRHRPLGGRPRPARRRRVPEDARRRRRRPDRRVRLLRRRRDPDRGGRTVDRLQGDRVGRRRVSRSARPT